MPAEKQTLLREHSGEELALRQDLVVQQVEEEGSVFYVIKDPVNRRFFRVKPLEHFLISQFDGRTSLEEISRRASEEYQVLVRPEVLSQFAAKFLHLGLLAGPGGQEAASPPRPGEGRWSRIASHKIPLFNPERLIDWLHPKVRWTLSPIFAALMTTTILFAAGLAVVNRESLLFGLGTIASLEGLLLFFITIFCVTLLHELAHAVTCRHFGGSVPDMGFLFMYFVPCFYCDLSDTYLIKEKRHRLWVSFAGGFFELFLWALAVIGWRVIAPEVFVSQILLIVVCVCGIRSLINFTPLIKLDGYYMLVDILGVTNLRREALAGLGRFMRRRLLGLEIEPSRPELAGRSIFFLRGDRFIALFGAASLVFAGLLLATIIIRSGDWVFGRYGPSGLGFFSLALVGLLRKPAGAAVSTGREVGKETWKELGKKKKRRRVVVIWTLIPAAVVFFPWQLRIRSDLEVLPHSRFTVRSTTEGRIERIHFAEGDRVERGNLLLEYDTKALILEKEIQEAELAKAKEELRLLGKVSPTVQEEIRVQERALETARTREAAARQEFGRTQELFNARLLSQENLDKARSELEQTESERRWHEARIELVLKDSRASRSEQIEMLHLRDPEAQRAVIRRLEAEVARLEDLLYRSRAYAPISGTLTTYRFQEKLGEYLEEGDLVCEIVDDDKIVIEMPVPEKQIDAIQVGYPVKFKVRGYPHRSFRTEVMEMAPVAQRNERISTILIRATLDNEEHVLKPGMTGVAKVYCGLTVVGHVFLRDLIRFIRTEFWL